MATWGRSREEAEFLPHTAVKHQERSLEHEVFGIKVYVDNAQQILKIGHVGDGAPGMTAVIAAHHLTIRFGAFTAVDDVSFAVGKGEVFGFLGPNGSGKTTIIKARCGLLRPSEGTGHILGMDIRKDAAEVSRHVGYMSQKFGSVRRCRTVAENMNFYIWRLRPFR